MSQATEKPRRRRLIFAPLSPTNRIPCEYMDVDSQNKFMQNYPLLNAHIPWDCVQRRNVAVLKARADGADIVVTVDDDNFWRQRIIWAHRV